MRDQHSQRRCDTTELEKAGISVVQVTAVTPVAKMVWSNRIVLGHGIVHLLGDADLSLKEEKDLRRWLVQQALEALKSDDKS